MNLSTEDVGPEIEAYLLQFYPILLSTLLSIKHQQLSIFDARYALILSSSPLTLYLVIASICDLCRFKASLYQQIKSHCRIIRFFGILMPLFWLGLGATLVLSNQAFKDSGLCQDQTLKERIVNCLSTVWDPFAIIAPLQLPFGYNFTFFIPFQLFAGREFLREWKNSEGENLTRRLNRSLVKSWCVPVVVDTQSRI